MGALYAPADTPVNRGPCPQALLLSKLPARWYPEGGHCPEIAPVSVSVSLSVSDPLSPLTLTLTLALTLTD